MKAMMIILAQYSEALLSKCWMKYDTKYCAIASATDVLMTDRW